MTKIKFFIFLFFLFIPEFVYSNDNLANFIIRDYSEGELPIVGNPDAKYTIVEFFDYRCGYCSKQANDLEDPSLYDSSRSMLGSIQLGPSLNLVQSLSKRIWLVNL